MRPSPFRRLLIALGVAFLAVLGLVLWLGGPRSELRLADGTRLRLLGVTAGTANVTFEIIAQRVRTMEFYLEPPRESGWAGPPPEPTKAASPTAGGRAANGRPAAR